MADFPTTHVSEASETRQPERTWARKGNKISQLLFAVALTIFCSAASSASPILRIGIVVILCYFFLLNRLSTSALFLFVEYFIDLPNYPLPPPSIAIQM